MDRLSDIPIIVLAAGQSRRMGDRDKLLEEIQGVPLLRKQAAMARAVTRAEVIVALPPRPHLRYAALKGLDVTCIEITDADEGMNASLRTAFRALPPDAPAAMLLLGDMPDLTEKDLATVLKEVDPDKDILIWRGATEDGKPGHPIVFASVLFADFQALKGDGGGREVVARAGERVALIPLPGQNARLDLDTPQDWAAWRTRQS